MDNVLVAIALILIFGGGMALDSANNTVPMLITIVGGILLGIEAWRFKNGRF